jgi:hypothetical protein
MEIVLFFGFVLPIVVWYGFYKTAINVHSFRPRKTQRIVVAVFPLMCAALDAAVIWKWASPDVRSNPQWIVFYVLSGATWLRLGLAVLSFLGVSARDDVFERQNAAAAWVVCGVLTGTAFCYAGGNIGRGPGPEAVFFCAALATVSLFALWFGLDSILEWGERATIGRSEQTGIRAAGWMSGAGLILGAGVVGNWKSYSDTVHDFTRPLGAALLFTIVVAAIEWTCRSKQEAGRRKIAVAIAAGYLATAAVYVIRWGAK